MKRLAILGSTGSIGINTLDVVRGFRDEFSVTTLAAGKNLSLLRSQIETFHPRLVSVADEGDARVLQREVSDRSIEIVHGTKGLIAVATHPDVDMVVSAVVGGAGLLPLVEAIEHGKNVALANKEALVMAGQVVMERAGKRGVRILPIDSEHSAIFQSLGGRRVSDGVKRIVLTGTGGPFYATVPGDLRKVTPREATAHPVWNMGAKISVDSATLMNKGLEVIEARWLFEMPPESIDVVIHPQGVVHSMVEFVDGVVIAQLGIPDMKIPISYALSYPERLRMDLPTLDFTDLPPLTFSAPDYERFPCLRMAYSALKAGGVMPTVLNGANEVAVDAFLQGKIRFDQIAEVVIRTVERSSPGAISSIDDILLADGEARTRAGKLIDEVA